MLTMLKTVFHLGHKRKRNGSCLEENCFKHPNSTPPDFQL